MLKNLGNKILKACGISNYKLEKSRIYGLQKRNLKRIASKKRQYYNNTVSDEQLNQDIFKKELNINYQTLKFFLANLPKFASNKNEAELAGEEAEDNLKNVVFSQKNLSGSRLWTGKRVKFENDSGKNEIDLILLTQEKIYLFECKGVSGQLHIDSNNLWTISKQEYDNGRKTGNVIKKELPNFIEILDVKKKKLLQHLLENNLIISNDQIEIKIIFMNRNLKLSSISKKCNEIIVHSDLQQYLTSVSQDHDNSQFIRIIHALIKFIYDNEQKNIASQKIAKKSPVALNFEYISRIIDCLPTWDFIYLDGEQYSEYEKILKCDITHLRSIFLYCDEALLSQARKIAIECPRTSSDVDIFMKREYFIKLCLYSEEGKLLKVLSGNFNCESSYVQFYLPGYSQRKRLSLYQINSIYLGGLYKPEKELR
jgi:hypothetical protein